MTQPEPTNPDNAVSPLQDHHLFCLAADWQSKGHQLALAIVISTWGSSPRQVGSVMLVRQDMQIAGSVSGGCIEGAVIEAALEAIEQGTGQRLDFGIADETAWEVGLSCGGRISVLVIPVAEDGLPAAKLQQIARQVTSRQLVQFSADAHTARLANLTAKEQGEAMRSWLDEAAGLFHFVQPPPPRLIIIGAVHITQHLSAMAAQTGFQVVVIDPRSVFASQQRFSPDVDLQLTWPSDYLAVHKPDSSTALVTLTHDPKIDDDALVPALGAPLFYLACLGSRRTHDKRLSRLAEAGATEDQLSNIIGPAGLAIGAKSPAEIAVSILAQLIAAWHSGPGAPPPNVKVSGKAQTQAQVKAKFKDN